MDNFPDTDDHVAPGDGDVVHAEWVYSHPAGSGDRVRVDQDHSRPTTYLASWLKWGGSFGPARPAGLQQVSESGLSSSENLRISCLVLYQILKFSDPQSSSGQRVVA